MVNPSARKIHSLERSPTLPPFNTSFSPLQYKFALATIRSLKKNKNAGPFLLPVDPVALGIPHYPDVIKHPMDFATIERKLFTTVPGQTIDQVASDEVSGRYWTVDEWLGDVHLVFQNSYTFNGPGHAISQMASALEDMFLKQCKKMPTADERLSLSIPPSGGTSAGPYSAATLDYPSSREQSQAETPFFRNSLDLPPTTSTSAMSQPCSNLHEQQMSFCSKVLDHFHKPEFQHFAWFFYHPVQEIQVPGYHSVIDKPMSLAVMREKLDKGEYSETDAFKADFDQIIWNCNKFNPVGSAAQVGGKQLKDVFLKKWKGLPGGAKKQASIKLVRSNTVGSTTVPTPTVSVTSAVDSVPTVFSPTAMTPLAPTPPPAILSATPASELAPSLSVPALAPIPASVAPALVTPSASAATLQASSSGLLPSHLPHPSFSTSSAAKRKSDIFSQEPEQADALFDHEDYVRLAGAIHDLTGAELKRAVKMIQEGIAGTPVVENETGDVEYEIAAMPGSLVRALHEAFVPRRLKLRPAKRSRIAGVDSGGPPPTRLL